MEDGAEKPYTNEDRLSLATREVNKFPVFKPRDKDTAFRQHFRVPLINKETDEYNTGRPAPTLGMRQGATFVAKPLHDPSGEFAIVLYDPTIDNIAEEPTPKDKEETKEDQPKLDEPLVHKSLADILGLKKKVEGRPKVPVVIDPRLAKVLRPHQVEGVKVTFPCPLVPADSKPRLLTCTVSVSMYYGSDRQARQWLYHGGRHGSGQNGMTELTALVEVVSLLTIPASMHLLDVDITQARSRSRKDNHSEVCDRLSV